MKDRKHEWLVVVRSKATGKIIKSISLNFDAELMEHIDKQPNFSRWAEELFRADLKRCKAEQVQAKELKIELTKAEQHVYDLCKRYFREYGYMEYGKLYEILPMQPDSELLSVLIGDVYATVRDSTLEDGFKNEILKLVEAVKEDSGLWDQLYGKFTLYWRQQHPVPEEYLKEVIPGWTVVEILAKCLPKRGQSDEGDEITTSQIAAAIGVNYQQTYTKVIPVIRSFLTSAGVKLV